MADTPDARSGEGGAAPYARAADVYDLIYDGIGKEYAVESRDVAAAVRSRRPDARSLLDVACGTAGTSST